MDFAKEEILGRRVCFSNGVVNAYGVIAICDPVTKTTFVRCSDGTGRSVHLDALTFVDEIDVADQSGALIGMAACLVSGFLVGLLF